MTVLSESDVSVQWRHLFSNGEITPQTLRAAQRLLDKLPPESPLRIRYGNELDQVRELRRKRKSA